MALHLNFRKQTPPTVPKPDDGLLHKGNELALANSDARESKEACRQNIKQKINDPATRRLHGASNPTVQWSAATCGAVAILSTIEYYITQPIYELLVPGQSWLPFLAIRLYLFWIASVLGKFTRWRIFPLRTSRQAQNERGLDEAMNDLYDQRSPVALQSVGRTLHYCLLLAATVLVFYFLHDLSATRVALQIKAGERAAESAFMATLWSPLLIAGEIGAAIPGHFFPFWLVNWLLLRYYRSKYTEVHRNEFRLRNGAVRNYFGYMRQVEEYNNALEPGQPPYVPIGPNQALLRLLGEFTDQGQRDNDNDDDDAVDDAVANEADPDPPKGGSPANAHQPQDDDDHLEDFLDDEINNANLKP